MQHGTCAVCTEFLSIHLLPGIAGTTTWYTPVHLPGTGLQLSACTGVCEEHGGKGQCAGSSRTPNGCVNAVHTRGLCLTCAIQTAQEGPPPPPPPPPSPRRGDGANRAIEAAAASVLKRVPSQAKVVAAVEQIGTAAKKMMALDWLYTPPPGRGVSTHMRTDVDQLTADHPDSDHHRKRQLPSLPSDSEFEPDARGRHMAQLDGQGALNALEYEKEIDTLYDQICKPVPNDAGLSRLDELRQKIASREKKAQGAPPNYGQNRPPQANAQWMQQASIPM